MNVSDATPVGVMAYNYAVVGVQKGGTSTLAVTLNQHRLVCQPPDKERHYFDDETVDWSAPDYARDYTAPRRAPSTASSATRHRRTSTGRTRWSGCAPTTRDMPLIAVFRDPLERLFSHWVMLRSRNLAWPDWPDFLTEWPHTSLPDEVPDDVRTMRWRHMTGLARGFYGEQLQRGFELFPRHQWLLLELRSMLGDFEATVHRTTDFLELPRFERVPPLKNWHAGAEQSRARRRPPTTCPGWPRSTPRTSRSSRSCPASTPRPGRPASSSTAGSTPASWPPASRARSAEGLASRGPGYPVTPLGTRSDASGTRVRSPMQGRAKKFGARQ